MLRRGELSAALRGVIAIAHGRPVGALLIAADREGARNSFLAAPIVFVPWMLTELLLMNNREEPAALPLALLVWTLSFVIQWSAVPLVARAFFHAEEMQAQLFRFIAAQNWASLILTPLFALVIILSRDSSIPPILKEIGLFAALIYYFVFKIFVIRFSLGVDYGMAIAFAGFCTIIVAMVREFAFVLLYTA